MDERIRRLNEDLERDLEAHDDEGGFRFRRCYCKDLTPVVLAQQTEITQLKTQVGDLRRVVSSQQTEITQLKTQVGSLLKEVGDLRRFVSFILRFFNANLNSILRQARTMSSNSMPNLDRGLRQLETGSALTFTFWTRRKERPSFPNAGEILLHWRRRPTQTSSPGFSPEFLPPLGYRLLSGANLRSFITKDAGSFTSRTPLPKRQRGCLIACPRSTPTFVPSLRP